MWRSRRTAVDQPWAAPEAIDVPAVATVIEIAPDGLEMFSNRVGGEVVAMRRPTRDAAWPGAMDAAFDGSLRTAELEALHGTAAASPAEPTIPDSALVLAMTAGC